jgi:hypothetical protein
MPLHSPLHFSCSFFVLFVSFVLFVYFVQTGRHNLRLDRVNGKRGSLVGKGNHGSSLDQSVLMPVQLNIVVDVSPMYHLNSSLDLFALLIVQFFGVFTILITEPVFALDQWD